MFFFQNLNMIVNVVCSFCKHNDELQVAYVTKISHLVANDEIETGRGANQIGTLVILDEVLISIQFVVFYACIMQLF